MFAAGVLDEVATTGEVGPTAAKMIGLAEIRDHLVGKITLDACMETIRQATRQYARRQLTWFRKERAFAWIDLSVTPDPLAELLRGFQTRR